MLNPRNSIEIQQRKQSVELLALEKQPPNCVGRAMRLLAAEKRTTAAALFEAN